MSFRLEPDIQIASAGRELKNCGAICSRLASENVLAEPVGRDTAAAVGLATVLVKAKDPDACFAMLPADHVIHDAEGFQSVLEAAFKAAEQEDALVTIGIKAAFPATGYGYIHRGEISGEASGKTVYAVKAFREKPDLDSLHRGPDPDSCASVLRRRAAAHEPHDGIRCRSQRGPR